MTPRAIRHPGKEEKAIRHSSSKVSQEGRPNSRGSSSSSQPPHRPLLLFFPKPCSNRPVSAYFRYSPVFAESSMSAVSKNETTEKEFTVLVSSISSLT